MSKWLYLRIAAIYAERSFKLRNDIVKSGRASAAYIISLPLHLREDIKLYSTVWTELLEIYLVSTQDGSMKEISYTMVNVLSHFYCSTSSSQRPFSM